MPPKAIKQQQQQKSRWQERQPINLISFLKATLNTITNVKTLIHAGRFNKNPWLKRNKTPRLDFLGLNLIFLLAPCPNPVRWEGWMSDLVEAFSLRAAASQGRRVDEKTISAPSRNPRGTTAPRQLSANNRPDYPKTPQKPSFQAVENHLSDSLFFPRFLNKWQNNSYNPTHSIRDNMLHGVCLVFLGALEQSSRAPYSDTSPKMIIYCVFM